MVVDGAHEIHSMQGKDEDMEDAVFLCLKMHYHAETSLFTGKNIVSTLNFVTPKSEHTIKKIAIEIKMEIVT